LFAAFEVLNTTYQLVVKIRVHSIGTWAQYSELIGYWLHLHKSHRTRQRQVSEAHRAFLSTRCNGV